MRFVTPLDDAAQAFLKKLMKNAKTFRLRQRAHAILLSNKRYSIEAIADIYDVHRDTVSRWIKHWNEKGVEGLEDAPKPGRPKKKASENSTKTDYITLSKLRRI